MGLIRVLKIEPLKEPEVITIENSYQAFQKEVGGRLEQVALSDKVSIFMDAEGMMQEKPMGNRRINDDIIIGTVLLVGTSDCKIVSLSEDYIALYTRFFKEPVSISEAEMAAYCAYKQYLINICWVVKKNSLYEAGGKAK